MRRAILTIIVFFVFGSFSFLATAQGDAYDFRLEKIYAQPDENSRLIYKIPIEITLLTISEDANWYKVKIAYDLGILGRHSFQGWIKIPIGDLLGRPLTSKH